MKKFIKPIIILLIATLAIGLVACNKTGGEGGDSSKTVTSNSTAQSTPAASTGDSAKPSESNKPAESVTPPASTEPATSVTPSESSGGEFEEYTVTFDYNDGKTRARNVIVDGGDSVRKPTDPTRDGYDFAGWATAVEGGTAVTFPYTPTGDVTIYALWTVKSFTVTLDYNFNNQKEEKTVAYGGELAAPNGILREGYALLNWTDESGNEVTFPLTVRKDMTIKANWVEATSVVTVSFELGIEGTDNPADKVLNKGEQVTDADVGIFSRSGYNFVGWATSADAAESDAFQLPYTANENVTLYAIWSIQKYTMTFRFNDAQRASSKTAQTYTTVEVAFGEKITAPATAPTRDGYTFIGWYGTAKGGTVIDFDAYTMPARNADVYAHWEHVAVQTNIFQAEYTYFDPAVNYPGYSGGTTGSGVVTAASEDTANCYVDNDYPVAYGQPNEHEGKYVTYFYKKGLTLTFVINSDKAVDNVTLKLNASIEIATEEVTFEPEGDFGYTVKINGVDQDYEPFTLEPHPPVSGAGMWAGDFSEVTLLTNVSLKEGENVIELIVNNENAVLGGTTAAMAPQVDYIKLENYGDAVLSWKPIYDNLY